MALRYEVKPTSALTAHDVSEITRLFREVFGKPFPDDVFYRKFRGPLGDSVHSLLFLDEVLIGAFSAIPLRYRFFDAIVPFAITADLMIDRRHRGRLGQLKRLADGLYQGLAERGVAFVFCCLRDEILEIHRAVSKWRAIGKVYYYVAPLYAWMRTMTRAVSLMQRCSSTAHEGFSIEKVNDDAFAKYRYQIFPIEYQTAGKAVYTTEFYYPIEGIPSSVRLGLLLDVDPMSKGTFDSGVIGIRQREPQINALAYQGRLSFQPRDMIRVPAFLEKQAWTLGGLILRPDLVDERVFEISNWNINLSNGDLV